MQEFWVVWTICWSVVLLSVLGVLIYKITLDYKIKEATMRNVCAQSGKCQFCEHKITRHHPRQLWQARVGDLAAHDPEYCPESHNHAHKLAPIP
jgi:hypothetical protein